MIGNLMKPYRYNVGIALFNNKGLVFVGKAISDGPEYVVEGYEWQMPQGGIDPNEDIETAARRELFEETGIQHAQLLKITNEWWAYDFPPYQPTGHRLEIYQGQQQRWVAFRFEGNEADINLNAKGNNFYPEFSDWRWVSVSEAIENVIPYKRANYLLLAEAFKDFAHPVR
jgi:putative (di)nucleoside polyphosphate hydrolase